MQEYCPVWRPLSTSPSCPAPVDDAHDREDAPDDRADAREEVEHRVALLLDPYPDGREVVVEEDARQVAACSDEGGGGGGSGGVVGAGGGARGGPAAPAASMASALASSARRCSVTENWNDCSVGPPRGVNWTGTSFTKYWCMPEPEGSVRVRPFTGVLAPCTDVGDRQRWGVGQQAARGEARGAPGPHARGSTCQRTAR